MDPPDTYFTVVQVHVYAHCMRFCPSPFWFVWFTCHCNSALPFAPTPTTPVEPCAVAGWYGHHATAPDYVTLSPLYHAHVLLYGRFNTPAPCWLTVLVFVRFVTVRFL